MILACDFDGTLQQNGQISQANIAAIQKFQQAGHLFVLCTGRAFLSAKCALQNQVTPDYMICLNGAMICDKNGTVLFHQDLDFKEALQLIEFCQKTPLNKALISDGIYYGLLKMKDEINDAKFQHAGELQDVLPLIQGGRINSFVIEGESTSVDEVIRFIEQHQLNMGFHRNGESLDITVHHINKAEGCKVLMDYLNCTEIEVIGDDYNDIAMIQEFDGFAMRQTVDAVLQVSHKIVDSVAQCIETLMK